MIFLFFIFFLISSAQVANKYLAMFLIPELIVFIRMGISGFLLFLIYCGRDSLLKVKDNIYLLFLISFSTTFIPSILKAYAFQYISASRASFWGGLEPFFTSIWLYILFRQGITRNQFFGCLISFFGSFFFIIMQAKENLFLGSLIGFGDIAQIGSVIISRFGWIQVQKLINKDVLKPKELNAYGFLISSIISGATLMLRGEVTSIVNFPYHNTIFMISLFYSIFIGNMIAYGLYASALKDTPITYISIAGLSVPLFVHLLSVVIGVEALSPSFFISLLFVSFALYIFQKKEGIEEST